MTTSNANQSEQATVEGVGGNRYEAGHVDDVFDVLSDARRRRVVRVLRDHGDTARVSDLAATLAVREPGEQNTESLVVSLRHVHLPKLEATGIVEMVDDDAAVRYGDAPLVETVLEQI